MINTAIYIALLSQCSILTRSISQQEYTHSCHAVEINTGSIIDDKSNTNYEVMAGKPFAYVCEFMVETLICDRQPTHLDCEEHEITWGLPETLRNIVQENGVTRVNTTVHRERKEQYDMYHSYFNITNVGTIHDGVYTWKQQLKFQDRIVNEGAFNIKVIDMIASNQPCAYADTCASTYCVDGACANSGSTVSWLVIGLILGGVIIVILIVVAAVVTIVLRKKSSNNRRHN